MAAGDQSSSGRAGDDDPDRAGRCAPVRQTILGEIDALYRFAAARLRHDTHLAEDVVQQGLLIAMTHASPPAEVGRQCAWLRGIVQNVIRRETRSQRRGRAAMERVALEPPRGALDDAGGHGGGGYDARGHDAGGHAGGAYAGGAHADDREAVVRSVYLAVTELDSADQDLFYAFYRSGRSQESIAAELGTTVKAVEGRLYRLRSRLRAALTRRGE